MSFQDNPLLGLSTARNLPSTLKELRMSAKAQGIKGASKMSKLELAQRLGMAGGERPPRKTLRVAGQKPKKPTMKPPRVSRAMLMKRVKAKKKAECDKYLNLQKKSMSQLRELL